jgi:peptidoglycan/LPS O-acetylase OafA/YrhL
MGKAKPSWKIRRRAIFGSMAFGAGIVIYVALRWDDLRIAETLALGGFGLIASALAFYTGGATYEDVKLHGREADDGRDWHG